jgi:hypothetical protein
MSELLIGMLIGFTICWGIVRGTEASFERRAGALPASSTPSLSSPRIRRRDS